MRDPAQRLSLPQQLRLFVGPGEANRATGQIDRITKASCCEAQLRQAVQGFRDAGLILQFLADAKRSPEHLAGLARAAALERHLSERIQVGALDGSPLLALGNREARAEIGARSLLLPEPPRGGPYIGERLRHQGPGGTHLRGDAQRALVRVDRQLIVSLRGVHETDVVLGLRHRVLVAERPSQIQAAVKGIERAHVGALRAVDVAERVEASPDAASIARLFADGEAAPRIFHGHRVVTAAEVHQRDSTRDNAGAPPIAQFLEDRERLLVVRQRIVEVAHGLVHVSGVVQHTADAAAVAGRRPQVPRLPAGRERLWVVALVEVDVADRVPCLGQSVRVAPLLVESDALLGDALRALELGHSKQAVGRAVQGTTDPPARRRSCAREPPPPGT